MGPLCTVQRWCHLAPGPHGMSRGDSSKGTQVGVRSWQPPYLWCQGTSPVQAPFWSPTARSSWGWGAGCEGASGAAATDFPTLGVPREGSRRRVRIPSRGLPLIPFQARESLA